MDSARLFLCALCRTRVVLCSRCDRGNRYCGKACSRQARDAACREAARRYQRSRRGRAAHAERMRGCRERAAARAAGAGEQAKNVTHQGCLDGPTAAPLAPCTNDDSTCVLKIAALDAPVAPAALDSSAGRRHCRRCAAPLTGWLRQGFVRHALRRARRDDHLP